MGGTRTVLGKRLGFISAKSGRSMGEIRVSSPWTMLHSVDPGFGPPSLQRCSAFLLENEEVTVDPEVTVAPALAWV